MTVNTCGMNTTHGKDFVINNPRGSDDYLFIFTKTPVIIKYNDCVNKYPAETTVLFKKGDQQHFMAAGDVYTNDYIHFNAFKEDVDYIESLNIPSGKPFFNVDSSSYMNIHKQIVMEYMP